jgi:hypothetical protein
LREYFSVDHLIPLEFPEMLGEHFLGRTGDEALKFAEAAGLVLEIEEDERLPLAPDYFSRKLDRAIISVHGILR